jgi:hypothetical protein
MLQLSLLGGMLLPFRRKRYSNSVPDRYWRIRFDISDLSFVRLCRGDFFYLLILLVECTVERFRNPATFSFEKFQVPGGRFCPVLLIIPKGKIFWTVPICLRAKVSLLRIIYPSIGRRNSDLAGLRCFRGGGEISGSGFRTQRLNSVFGHFRFRSRTADRLRVCFTSTRL